MGTRRFPVVEAAITGVTLFLDAVVFFAAPEAFVWVALGSAVFGIGMALWHGERR